MGDGLRKAKEYFDKAKPGSKEQLDAWVDYHGEQLFEPWYKENYKVAKQFYDSVRPRSRGSAGRESAETKRDSEVKKIQKEVSYERNRKQLADLYKPVPPTIPEKIKTSYSGSKQ